MSYDVAYFEDFKIEGFMPKVGKKKFPYTKKGYKEAEEARKDRKRKKK